MKKQKQLVLWMTFGLIFLAISQRNLGVLADDDEDTEDDDDEDEDDENGISLDPAQTVSDSTSSQKFSCSSSSSTECLFKFSPGATFTGVIEATVYIPSIEGDSVLPQSTPPYAFLFCDQNTNECDYTGQYLKLRNLSISGTFTSGITYSFSLSALCGTTNTLSVYITVKKAANCVNNNCGSNGTCAAISSDLGQCICNSSHGAKNCQAAVQEVSPNTEQTLTIASMSSSLVKFQFDVSKTNLMTNNQLNLILSGVANPSCLMYILDSSSQTDNGYVFSFQNSSLNINNLFSTGSSSYSARLLRSLSTQIPLTSSYNFNLLLLITNKSASSQDIVLSLKITEVSSSSGKGDKMFLYFIIGMAFLTFIIILSTGIYYIQRRRIIAQKALQANILAALQNNLSTSKDETKREEEDFEAFFALFCQAIPSQTMNSAKLDQILRQSLERKTAVKVCTCSICLSPIEIKNSYRTSMCNHQFHTLCIDAWIKKQRNCPMCRTPHDTADLEKFMKNGKILLNFETIKVQGQQIQFEMVDNPAFSLGQAQEPSNIPISILQGSRQQQQQQSFQMGKRVTFSQKLTKEQEPQKDKSPFLKNKSPETLFESQLDFRLSNIMKTADSSTIRGPLSPLEKMDPEQFSVFALSDSSNNSVILSGNSSAGKNSLNNNLSPTYPQQLKLSQQYTFERQQNAQAHYLKSKFKNSSPLLNIQTPTNDKK